MEGETRATAPDAAACCVQLPIVAMTPKTARRLLHPVAKSGFSMYGGYVFLNNAALPRHTLWNGSRVHPMSSSWETTRIFYIAADPFPGTAPSGVFSLLSGAKKGTAERTPWNLPLRTFGGLRCGC